MAERSPKSPDPLDEPVDVLPKPADRDDLDRWGDDELDSGGSDLSRKEPS